MAGIYIHIPFCKKACHYCNFFFSTSLHFKDAFLNALHHEISLQKNYLANQTIESIYFGGGTPSLLNKNELQHIIHSLKNSFTFAPTLEICLEANPDDLSKKKLRDLFDIGINRLSIGVQSFFDEDLVFMNRAHTFTQINDCLLNASSIGFKDLSIDLIYGVPTQNLDKWQQNLNKILDYNINHVSCYALTVEESTPLFHQIRKGKTPPINDAFASDCFSTLSTWAKENNWQHYEISNLCKNENYSKHNTSYWQGKHYLGLGPAAHSFNGTTRQWNIANMKKYIDSLKENKVPFQVETLSKTNQFNEYIMTGLRTQWGIDLHYVQEHFPLYYPSLIQELAKINPAWISVSSHKITLKQEGKFYADGIASSLFG